MPDQLAVELIVDDQKATVKLDNFGQKMKLVSADINKVGGDTRFGGKLTTDLDALSKRAEDVRKQFAEVAKVSIGNGTFSKDIFAAQNRARQLVDDIVNIRKELANPGRTSSIAFLTSELKGATQELDSLSGKLKTLPSPSNAAPADSTKQSGFGRIRGFGAIFRAADLGINESELNAGLAAFDLFNEHIAKAATAKTALTAATTASTAATAASTVAQTAEGTAAAATTVAVEAETVAYAGLTVASLGLFGAVAAIGFAAYEATKRIRTEAEHRLEVENKITGELNKQRIAAKELVQNFAEQESNADRADKFSRDLKSDSFDDLTRRKQNLERAIEQAATLKAALDNIPSSELNNKDAARTRDNDDAQNHLELSAVNRRLRELPFEENKTALDAFNKHNEDFKKSQADDAKVQLKKDENAAVAAAKKLQEIDKAKTKIGELEKQYLLTFDNLTAKAASDNPFVAVFTAADKALRELKSNLRGLPAELQNAAVALQRKINFRQLLEAQTNNQLSALDLRNSAENFRNPFDADGQKKNQDEFVKNFLARNPNYLFLNNKTSLDDETRSQILKQFAPSGLTETPADRLNKSLDEKFNLLYKPGQTAEQQAIGDKRFISLTQGVNPLDLSKSLRESAALVREREAIRQERYQQDALNLYREQRDYQKRIADNTAAQNKAAEQDGGKSLKITLKDETQSGGATFDFLPERPGFELLGGTNL